MSISNTGVASMFADIYGRRVSSEHVKRVRAGRVIDKELEEFLVKIGDRKNEA